MMVTTIRTTLVTAMPTTYAWPLRLLARFRPLFMPRRVWWRLRSSSGSVEWIIPDYIMWTGTNASHYTRISFKPFLPLPGCQF